MTNDSGIMWPCRILMHQHNWSTQLYFCVNLAAVADGRLLIWISVILQNQYSTTFLYFLKSVDRLCKTSCFDAGLLWVVARGLLCKVVMGHFMKVFLNIFLLTCFVTILLWVASRCRPKRSHGSYRFIYDNV